MSLSLSDYPEIIAEFCDVKVTLCDGLNSVQMDLHKVILAPNSKTCCDFFSYHKRSLYITLKVDNLEATKAVILSFYGYPINLEYPEWRSRLEIARSKLFLKTPNCQEHQHQLHNLEVPAEGYDLLLDVAKRYDQIDRSLISILRWNMPNNYDLSLIPIELADKSIDKKNFLALIVSGKSIYILNLDGTSISNVVRHFNHDFELRNLTVSPNNNIVACIDENNHVIVCNLATKIMEILEFTDNVNALAFFPNNHDMIFGCIEGNIIFFNINNEKFETILGSYDGSINSVSISSDGKMFACAGNNGRVKIFESDTKNCVIVYEHRLSEIYQIAFSPDNTNMVSVGSDGKIAIFNIDSKIIKTILTARGRFSFRFSSDSDLIYFYCPGGYLESYQISTETRMKSDHICRGDYMTLGSITITSDGKTIYLSSPWDGYSEADSLTLKHKNMHCYGKQIEKKRDLIEVCCSN